MNDSYVVLLNNSFICITEDYTEAEEFFNKQVENWKQLYKDKPIDNNDKLVLKNYSQEKILKQFSKIDLL